MGQYDISSDYLEIVSGTTNRTSPAYTEAVKSIDTNTEKGLSNLKNFITSIENIASKDSAKDERITASKGNLKAFQGYENIKTSMDFLKKNLPNMKILSDLFDLYEALNTYQSLYVEGYQKNVRLVQLEYESGVYMLVTGLAMTMANNVDVVTTGSKIKIVKKSGNTFGTIEHVLRDFAKQVSKKGHREYLEALIKTSDEKPVDTNIKTEEQEKEDQVKKESSIYNRLGIKLDPYTEAVVTDTFQLLNMVLGMGHSVARFGITALKTIKDTVFGIVPLIRSVLYLRYKKKADTILALDQQVQFIEQNINQLQNMNTMDEKKKEVIIKKQQAQIEAYKKRAEKLRAELTETEKDASTEIKKENPSMSKEDDEFVLEGVKISDLFNEGKEETVKVYDKAKWYIDKGDKEEDVVSRIKSVFEFLKEHDMLTKEGEETLKDAMDSSVSLTEDMVTAAGKDFLDRVYNDILKDIDSSTTSIKKELEDKFNEKEVKEATDVNIPVPGGLNEKPKGVPADHSIPTPSKKDPTADTYNKALDNLQKSFGESTSPLL